MGVSQHALHQHPDWLSWPQWGVLDTAQMRARCVRQCSGRQAWISSLVYADGALECWVKITLWLGRECTGTQHARKGRSRGKEESRGLFWKVGSAPWPQLTWPQSESQWALRPSSTSQIVHSCPNFSWIFVPLHLVLLSTLLVLHQSLPHVI